MHELGIVFHIIKSVERIGADNALSAVAAVTLDLGEVSGVVDTYLLDCWRWAADKSELLRGAKLNINVLPAATLCENCGKTYNTVEFAKVCPRCGSENTRLITGNEISIREIEAC